MLSFSSFNPQTSPFNCQLTSQLPFGGAELLVVSLLFMFLVVTLSVAFMDVAFKQMWPSTFLDPVVAARVAQIQKMFPKLQRSKNNAVGNVSPQVTVPRPNGDQHPRFVREEDIEYDSVASCSPYNAGRTVDEDLICILSNNNAFGTVSGYCSSSVRGYAMLSSTLLSAGIALGFMWIHNASVYPAWGNSLPGYLELIGFFFSFLTGFVMCGPSSHSVYRNANILLFTSVPLNSWVLKLHGIGVGVFIIAGVLTHLWAIITQGSSLPDYTSAVTGVVAQLLGAAVFGIAGELPKWGLITPVMGNKVSIIGELVLFFSTFVAYFQWVTYPSAVCLNAGATYDVIMLTTIVAPFVLFIVKHYSGTPTTFATPPSLILLNNGTPVATTGPVPTLQYDEDNLNLPIVS